MHAVQLLSAPWSGAGTGAPDKSGACRTCRADRVRTVTPVAAPVSAMDKIPGKEEKMILEPMPAFSI